MPAQPRKLGTTVEAVIYCELPVATTLHRAVAALLDWSLVLIGYGLFLLAFRLILRAQKPMLLYAYPNVIPFLANNDLRLFPPHLTRHYLKS